MSYNLPFSFTHSTAFCKTKTETDFEWGILYREVKNADDFCKSTNCRCTDFSIHNTQATTDQVANKERPNSTKTLDFSKMKSTLRKSDEI